MKIKLLLPAFLLGCIAAFSEPSAQAQTGTFTTVVDFGAYGLSSANNIILGDNNVFYGTTSAGGANGDGAVYSYSDGTLTILHSFDVTNGSAPHSGVVQGSDGSLYGVTSSGGTSSDGVVYKIDSTGNFSVLYNFNGTLGSDPEQGPILVDSTTLYGTCATGGNGNHGVVWKMSITGSSYSAIYKFLPANGDEPLSSLFLDTTDGTLWGTTAYGGTAGFGTIFHLTTTGTLLADASFARTTGARSHAAPIRLANGLFYGALTIEGLPSNAGSVYSYDPATNVVAPLHKFTGTDGTNPYSEASLLAATDGYIYGTTNGTIFRVNTAGKFTNLYATHETTFAGLIEGKDGTFYGVSTSGGPTGDGVLYSYVP